MIIFLIISFNPNLRSYGQLFVLVLYLDCHYDRILVMTMTEVRPSKQFTSVHDPSLSFFLSLKKGGKERREGMGR